MTDALEEAIRSAGDRATDTILTLSHDLHAHPEIAWEEVRSCARVASDLADAGFTVEDNYTGLPTAFAARRGSGPLRLAVCAEYDALPGLGHACGHNVIAAISTGAALALAPFVDDLGITLTVFGTPAEEGGGGKIEMLDRGGFTGIHAAAMVHPGPVDVARAEPYAVSHSHIRYEGKAAHAAAYPDRGINAADAFTIAQVAIGLLRQQFPHDVRVHGVMTNGGEAPNAIPQRTEGRWYVRAATLAELEDLEQRVNRCFEAGAHATGCELTITPESKPYAEFRNDEGLLDSYTHRAEQLGRRFTSGSDSLMNRASTDMGNVSQHIPAIHPYIGIASLPAVNHQPEFAAAAASPAADRAVVDGARALALTLLDAATDPATRQRLMDTADPQGDRR
jgi:amidohydrolase